MPGRLVSYRGPHGGLRKPLPRNRIDHIGEWVRSRPIAQPMLHADRMTESPIRVAADTIQLPFRDKMSHFAV